MGAGDALAALVLGEQRRRRRNTQTLTQYNLEAHARRIQSLAVAPELVERVAVATRLASGARTKWGRGLGVAAFVSLTAVEFGRKHADVFRVLDEADSQFEQCPEMVLFDDVVFTSAAAFMQLALVEGLDVAVRLAAGAVALPAVCDALQATIDSHPAFSSAQRRRAARELASVRQGDYLVCAPAVAHVAEALTRAIGRTSGVMVNFGDDDYPASSVSQSRRKVSGAPKVIDLLNVSSATGQFLRAVGFGGDVDAWRHGTISEENEERARLRIGLSLYALCLVLAHSGAPEPLRAAVASMEAFATTLPPVAGQLSAAA